ncbi:MAG: carbamoyltransferase HypF, partial [Actinomycetota bacterium]
MSATLVRRRVVVTGVVQGVGFRPFVHRLADELGLAGHVGNDSTCVTIEVEGLEPAVAELLDRLAADAPPLARIERIEASALEPFDQRDFTIVESEVVGGARTLVPPDVAVCDECVAELFDPGDRRHRYPFVTCTNCGPRFTIIRDLPYDRPNTTMAGFPLCTDCAREYHDPTDRRFHAQPLACEECGPRIRLDVAGGQLDGTDAVLARTQELLAGGAVVAVKGLGGYHLAADPRSEHAIAALRDRKGRVDKPFAVMVRDLSVAERLASLDDAERAALTDPARPVVLVRRRSDPGLSELLAPGNPLLGIMLPYTPLHHLLFAAVPGCDVAAPDVLVMTSANLSDEPIVHDDTDADQRLGHLADAVLRHDRPIHVPCDDSVVRVVDGGVQPIRRSRGHAPLPLHLPVEVAPTIAVGGELKNAACVATGRHAWMT